MLTGSRCCSDLLLIQTFKQNSRFFIVLTFQVHSLTGRDLPKSVREKRKHAYKSMFTAQYRQVQDAARDRIQSETAAAASRPRNVVERSKSTSDSTTMARTMFWQQRILSGETSDNSRVVSSFPPLPSEMFKKSVWLQILR